MSLLNNYKNQLNDYELKLESEKQRLTKFETKIKNNMDQIEHLEFKKNSVQSIQILKPPANSPKPIKRRLVLNVVLAFIAGIFLMVLLSFFIEYISKNSKFQ